MLHGTGLKEGWEQGRPGAVSEGVGARREPRRFQCQQLRAEVRGSRTSWVDPEEVAGGRSWAGRKPGLRAEEVGSPCFLQRKR